MLEIRRQPDELAATRGAYNVIYAERGIRQLDSLYLWLLELLKVEGGKRLLDVSCGCGGLLRLALARGLKAHGLDLADRAVLEAKTTGAGLAVADAEHLPYADGSFDYVTNIGSVEHYLHPDQALREMARVLKRSGLACILLPNSFGLAWNIYYVLRTGDIHDDGQPIQRYATRRQWSELLQANGLRIERVVKYEREFPRSFADLVWYLHHPKKLIHLLLSPLIPLNLASCFVYLCRRAERFGYRV